MEDQDTGWVKLTPGAGFNVGTPPAYRVKNGVLYMQGLLVRIAPAASDLTLTTLPLHLVKDTVTLWGRGFSGGSPGATIFVNPTTGVVRTAYTTASHVDWYLNSVIFPLEKKDMLQ